MKDPNISHAWIEYASIHDAVDYEQIYSEWEVPPNPTTNDGQVVFLFNGLEDINDVVTIIQPVLGWNNDYAGAWSIAAWNCCFSGDTWEGPPAPANPGDHLEGYVFSNCSKGSKTCGSWDIVGSGPDQGMVATLIPFTLQVTATRQAGSGQVSTYSTAATTGASVNISRTVEVALLPAFEFGIFCDGDCDE